MADSVEMQDIRGLDIDKAVKGFALIDYTFKNDCTTSTTSADHIRWYQETSADLTTSAPAENANISPLSTFPVLEPTWTRQTSYVKKYANRSFISMEDMKSSDIDVIARTLLRLTRSVQKQVDVRIYDVWTEASVSGTPNPTLIQTFAATQCWDTTSGSIVYDLMHAKKLLSDYGYNTEGNTLIINQVEYRDIVTWLIDYKGSSIPNFSSEKISSGVVMNLLGFNLKVSPNAVTDYALIVGPQACTWKTHTPITSIAIQNPGIGTDFRVWELGEAILTDPKDVVLITNTTT